MTRHTLPDTARRALTQKMTTLAPDEYDGVVEVYSESGESYLVDLEQGTCTCEDYLYRRADRDERCKHLHRAVYATGREDVPEDPPVEVDPELGRYVDDVPEPAHKEVKA